MRDLFFWQTWSPAHRALYFLILIPLLLLAVSIVAMELAGPENLLGWDTFARAETIRMPLETFTKGILSYTVESDSRIFWQFFRGGEPGIPAWAYYAYLILTGLAFITLTTVITHLRGIWYFAGASLLIAALVSLKLELLFLFDTEGKEALIITLILYVPAAYIFNRVKPDISFINRWLFFLGITVIFGAMIGAFSGIGSPYLHLATSSFYMMIILSMIFMLMIAHEILIAIIWLITSQTGTTGSMRHFLIFTAIYLLMLLAAYLSESGIVGIDLILINLFVILIISAFLGIWGFRKREEQYSYLLSFEPAGAFFYISMMLAAMSTLGLLLYTGNDPGKEVFRDFIVNGHLAFGILFLLYVLANFAGPLGNNLQVHKILFRPGSMPYFTFRLAGIITFLAFLLPAGRNVTVFQARSAFYNTLGDMYTSIRQPLFAVRYYQDAGFYGYNNHKSNYALGKFYAEQGAFGRAIPYFQNATGKWPTPQSYVELSNAYLETNRKYEAIFTLKGAIDHFPGNYELLNNLGLVFNETNIIDSAYMFMNRAYEQNKSLKASASNITGLLVKNEIDVNADSVINSYVDPSEPISRNNALVLKNRFRENWNISPSDYDSSLNFVQASVIYNELINDVYGKDSINRANIHRYTQYAANSRYREDLEFVEAVNLMKDQQVNDAFRLINAVANRSDDRDYFEVAGKWALNQDAPDVAVQYFDWSSQRKPLASELNLAAAYSENLQRIDAAALWEQIAAGENESAREIAVKMLDIYSQTQSSILDKPDSDKWLFLRYNLDPRDTTSFARIAAAINNNDLRAKAVLTESKRLMKLDMTDASIAIFGKISGLQLTDQELYEQITWHDLDLLAASRNISGLAQRINEGVEFDQEHMFRKNYFTALIKSYSNDKTALPLFHWVAGSNPFREEATVTAAQYISQYDRFKAYNYLIRALEINPNSIRLLKAYALQCAETQLDNYAAISLEELQKLIPSDEYNSFYQQYLIRVREVEQREMNFEE